MVQVEKGAARQWAGLRFLHAGIEVALVGADGGTLEVLRVSEDLQALVRVLKRWKRAHGFDPSNAVFCLDDSSAFPVRILERMLAFGWTIVLARTGWSRPNEDGVEMPGAAEVASMAMRSAIPLEALSIGRLNAENVGRLRQRREELAALRETVHTKGSLNGYLETELQREFERMDRRHVQLLDKLLSRLDSLIRLRIREGS